MNGGRTRAAGTRATGTVPDLDQLAHDLRTPLSAVLMWVRLLRSGAAPDPGAALASIEKSAVELSRAIDRLSPVSPPSPREPSVNGTREASGNGSRETSGNCSREASGNGSRETSGNRSRETPGNRSRETPGDRSPAARKRQRSRPA